MPGSIHDQQRLGSRSQRGLVRSPTLARRNTAYLDDSGTWQAASSPSSNTAYFGVGQTTNWSVSGNGLRPARLNAEAYPETGSAGRPTSAAAARTCTITASITATGSAGRRRVDAYRQRRRLRRRQRLGNVPAIPAAGPTRTSIPIGSGRRRTPTRPRRHGAKRGRLWLGQTQNGSWSGSVSASGNATQGYGYSTDSTYTSADGWTSTGTTSASVSGSMSASFLAGSPFASSIGDSYNGASFGGTVSGSGADWANYSFAQSQNLSGGAWSSASGAGAASGGSSATWGYSGSGSYSQTQDGGTVNGSEAAPETKRLRWATTSPPACRPARGWTQVGLAEARLRQQPPTAITTTVPAAGPRLRAISTSRSARAGRSEASRAAAAARCN